MNFAVGRGFDVALPTIQKFPQLPDNFQVVDQVGINLMAICVTA